MNIDREAIQEILKVARRLDEKKILNAIEGNISLKREGFIYITPSGKNKAFLTEEMIAVLDEAGNQVGGTCKPSSEMRLHLHAYRERPDVGGVVHAHPRFLTAYAVCGMPVRTKAYPEMLAVYGSFEVAAYGRPGTDGIFREVGPLLKERDVILLENHGALSVGPDVIQAMNHMEAAEAIAEVLTLSRLVGKEKELPQEEREAIYLSYKK